MERNKEKNFISVVLYLYNKEQEISVFLPKLYAMLEDNFLNFEDVYKRQSMDSSYPSRLI